MEDRWAKLEEIVRRVVREEIAVLGKKEKTKIKLVNGKWEGITPDVLGAFKDAYPAVEVEKELKEMVAWIFTHSDDAPKSNYGAFIQSWLKKHQDRHSIRSIPLERERKAPPNLCEYCMTPSVGSVNGRRYCNAHSLNAMDNEKPQRFMPGVVPKSVAGND